MSFNSSTARGRGIKHCAPCERKLGPAVAHTYFSFCQCIYAPVARTTLVHRERSTAKSQSLPSNSLYIRLFQYCYKRPTNAIFPRVMRQTSVFPQLECTPKKIPQRDHRTSIYAKFLPKIYRQKHIALLRNKCENKVRNISFIFHQFYDQKLWKR